MKTLVIVIAAATLLPCLPSDAGDLQDGVRQAREGAYPAATRAFRQAAAEGNAEANRRLGMMYYRGEGVPLDYGRAVSLLGKAAEAGDAEAATLLGKMVEFGMGVAADDARAAHWYTVGAELGDAPCQFEASVMLYQGRGVARDRAEAAKWWTLAQAGDSRYAEKIRRTVESAEAKLTAEELSDGRRRADEWRRRSGKAGRS